MTSRTTVMARTAGLLVFSGFALALGVTSLTNPPIAVAFASLPLVILASVFPQPFLVAAVALLPFPNDITGGLAAGIQVAPSDVFLALGFLGIVVRTLSHHSRLELQRLRPLLAPGGVYMGAVTLAVIFHPSAQGAFTIVQRFELLVVALVAGSFLAVEGVIQKALRVFVAFASVLAVVTILATVIQGTETGGFLGVQKNPAGQAIGGAFLVVISGRRFPAQPVVVALLAVGVLASLSRGAILATAVGLFVVALLQTQGHRLRLAGLAVTLGAAVVIAFNALPGEQQERLVEVSPETDYAAGERVRYADDARATFESAPFLGVGPGNYSGGDLAPGIADPHNVLLLEAAEGGIVLAGAFILLALAPLVVLARRRHRHPLVVTAIAVQVATVLHGLVDVYWVRGTPVLGWILVGAALALSRREQPQDARKGEPERSSS